MWCRVFAADERGEGEQAESGGSGWKRAGSEDWSCRGAAQRRQQHQQVSAHKIKL